ncbi:MAG TPA: ice-binding family protein, partial [Terriglobales bacterium]|nr:ice-binding family protein [Terriglobales bacterium]
VFQAGSSLTGVGNIILINRAQAKNVYWVNAAAATIGVGSAWQGNILAVSSITLNDNVTLLGRALTRIWAVTLGNNNVITLP